MTVVRWLAALTLGVIGSWIIVMNALCIAIWYARGRHSSMVPLIGGLSLALAVLSCPMPGASRWAWAPLAADPGCLLLGLQLGRVAIAWLYSGRGAG